MPDILKKLELQIAVENQLKRPYTARVLEEARAEIVRLLAHVDRLEGDTSTVKTPAIKVDQWEVSHSEFAPDRTLPLPAVKGK